MSRGSLGLAFLLGASVVLAREEVAVRHVQPSSDVDRSVNCIREVLGTPVIIERARPWVTGLGECPHSVSELLNVLSLKGFTLRVADDWSVLFPTRLRYGNPELGQDPWFSWDSIAVRLEVSDWGTIPGSRVAAIEERRLIIDRIRRQVRGVPVALPWRPGKDGDIATIELPLWLDFHQLATGSEWTGIAIYGWEEARLVVFEFDGSGAVRSIWDSPLFFKRDLRLNYVDVNADGDKEIVLLSSAGRRPRYNILSVFDSDGTEISRQENCGTETIFTGSEGVCPIVGLSLSSVSQANGFVDFVTPNFPDEPAETIRYALVHGHYEKVNTHP